MANTFCEIGRQQRRHYRANAAAAETALTDLSPATVRHIREAWEESQAAAGSFAADLYANLFALAPRVAALFPGDLAQQRRRLTQTLTDSLVLLDRPQELLLLLRASGVRHLHYHTDFQHFPLLGAALDTTFRQSLGERFSVERREAWQLFYSSMAAVMCGAMAAALSEKA